MPTGRCSRGCSMTPTTRSFPSGRAISCSRLGNAGARARPPSSGTTPRPSPIRPVSRYQVKAALEELEAGGGLIYDAAVLWVRNGLRFDPSLTLANEKHQKDISGRLDRLPKSPVRLNLFA